MPLSIASLFCKAIMEDTYKDRGARKRLIQELRTKGIVDEKVLTAMLKIPRHFFIQSEFRSHAYQDKAFKIDAGQTISQPYTVAYQTQLLQIEPGDKVLEVGTGSAYQSIILLELGVNLFTIERQEELFKKAHARISKFGYKATCILGDGSKGYIVPVYKAVGNMKRYCETLCDFFSNQIHDPMQCIIIRPSNAYGPNDKFDFEKCHVTPANIRKVADNLNPIPVWGDGTEVRDVIHVDDMVGGFITVAEKVDTYDIYNVSYGSGYTVMEVLDKIKEIEGNTNPVEFVNNKAPMIPVRLLGNDKLVALGWKAKYDLDSGLRDALKWYKENKDQFNPNSRP